jgi:CubicO group peptidase (beta-lactamase class C family)
LPELDAELSRLVRRAQADERLPSVSAAVFRGPELVWTEAVGLADAETGEEATPDHQYRIGSITKMFTAAAVLQLRDAGELSLDDPIGRHVPEAARWEATLGRLLSHHSGLQREPPGEIWESMQPPSREELLAGLEDAELVLEPGRHWHYSNLAFALLGEVVVRRTGSEYTEYVSERLLRPLGLSRTTWSSSAPVAKGYFVEPYADEIRLERYDVDLSGTAASGGLWSTVGDVSRWGAFLCDPNEAVLSRESAESMHSVRVMFDPDRWTLGYGLGTMLFRRGDRILGGHDGGMPGHVTFLRYAQAERIGAVVLTGSTAPGPPAAELPARLVDAALAALPTEVEPWRPTDAPPPELAGVTGRWWSEGSEFVFRWRSGRLEAVFPGSAREVGPAVFARERPDLYRTVSGRERGELLRIVRDERGAVVKLYWATYPFTREPEVFGA